MKKKLNPENLAEIFHQEAKSLSSTGIPTMALTSSENFTKISQFNFTFVQLIYLVRHFAENMPREFDLALRMADFTEANVPESDTIH